MPDAPVLLLMGPTASGKTALSLSLARQIDCEIISVDSALVYRGMDIGTAKPSLAERGGVAHHLIDILDPAEPYSAARFREDALRLIGQIRARGRTPLLVGGTMLYFRALTQGLSELPRADEALRARLGEDARRLGWPALHARLAETDPASAARLHPHDGQRIQRALEVQALTGQPLSQLQQLGPEPQRQWLRVALAPPERAVLHRRIAARFLQMMDDGLVDEVRRLYERGDLGVELPSIRAVGYRQIWAYLAGECTQAEAVQRGIAATRQFAKRQLTWLRSEPALHWVDATSPDALAELQQLLDAARALQAGAAC